VNGFPFSSIYMEEEKETAGAWLLAGSLDVTM